METGLARGVAGKTLMSNGEPAGDGGSELDVNLNMCVEGRTSSDRCRVCMGAGRLGLAGIT